MLIKKRTPPSKAANHAPHPRQQKQPKLVCVPENYFLDDYFGLFGRTQRPSLEVLQEAQN
jgi:hypothetical protein